MSEDARDELTRIFDKVFAGSQQHLCGTEQEIVIFKAFARQWFELGVQEGARVFFEKGQKVLINARSEVDKHFAFISNSR